MTEQEKEQAESLLSGLTPKFEAWLPLVTPAFTWDWPHQKAIYAELAKITLGLTDRLMISMPPRHTKSETVTVRYPAYRLERDPATRVIVGAYAQNLANKFSRKTKRIALARGVPLMQDRKAMDEWETPEEGGYRAAGVGSGVTGMGADLIVIDDPVKNRAEANSPTYRERVWEWYTDDLLTRLEPGGAMILIMTRWHSDDLAGRLLEREGLVSQGGEWHELTLPALAEPNDPLGRAEGEALCPDRYSVEALMRIKASIGASFDPLFQQRPRKKEGAIVEEHWVQRYEVEPARGDRSRIVQSWDTGFKDREENDPSVCTTWLIHNNGYYLLHVLRDRMKYPQLKRTVQSWAQKWQPSEILIEDKASGQSLIQDLKEGSRLPLIPVSPGTADKVERLSRNSSLFEAGLVFLPKHAPWLKDYEAELFGFPFVPHDDQVDSTSQFLDRQRVPKEVFIG